MTDCEPISAGLGPPLTRGRTALLLATVFLSGAAVMIVEMTAVRAIQPFFGSTTYVWANVIAVVLAALSAGYALGGRLADRHPSPTLLYSVMAAGAAALVAVAFLVTPVSRLFLARGVNLEGVTRVLVQGSLGTALVLFAPPILTLGAVSPLAIRLLSSHGVGRAAGRVFAVSTAGSIVGTYLPVMWLTPAFGSRGSILVAAGVLFAAAAVGFLGFRRRRLPAAILTALAAAALTRGAVPPGRGAPPLAENGVATVLAEVESPYQYLTVRDDVFPDGEVWRALTINEGVYTFHSLKINDRVMTKARYYDDYSILPILLDRPPGAELRGCIVGLACGVNAGQWKHFWDGLYRLSVDAAEIDPDIIALGRRHFGLPDAPWLRIFSMDGRQLLAALPGNARYDMLVVDAFTNELYVPFHLATREFFALCRRHLEPGGLLAMNVYAVGADAPNLAAIENTLATEFGSCVRVSQYGGRNFQLLARNGAEPPDLARLTPEAIRRRFREFPGYEAWRDLPEHADLVGVARGFLADTTVVTPRPDALVLTDDHAPLEYLSDRFLGTLDARNLADPSWRHDDLERLLAKQRKLLAAAGGAWLLLAAAALALALAFRRRPA